MRLPVVCVTVPKAALPVISNFTLLEDGFDGVTINPSALVVLVMKLIPTCEVLLDPMTEKGRLAVEPSVAVTPLIVVAEFVKPAFPSVPVNPACTTPVPVFVKVKVRPLNAAELIRFRVDWLILFTVFVCVVRPLAILAQAVALPFARIPVGAEPVEQRVGVPDNAAAVVAVRALPVVFAALFGMSPETSVGSWA